MRMIANILIGLIATLHFYIAWFEIFAWTSRGPKVFSSFSPELFEQTIPMAANQGIYNAFLAVGLVWALLIKDRVWSTKSATCFLTFGAIAGVVGAYTVSTRIVFVQTMPAVFALVFLYFSARDNGDSKDSET